MSKEPRKFSKKCLGKLPRKRKKAAMAAEGRKWYRNTIYLAKVEHEYPIKFWVTRSVVKVPTLTYDGLLVPFPHASQYW